MTTASMDSKMTNDPQKLIKIQEAVKQMIANNESPDYIDNFLQIQGETPESMNAINTYGAERVAKAREAASNAKLSDLEKAETRMQGLGEGIKETGEMLKSMGQEWLKDASAGLYGNAIGSESYNDLKQKVKQRAKDEGISWLESGTRGLVGLHGMMASPLFRAAKLIPGVRNSIMASAGLGNALYSGVQSASRGDSAKDVAINAAGSGLTGAAAAGTLLLGQKALRDITGAASGVNASMQSDIADAGARKSTAFKAGRKMTDKQAMDTVQEKVSEVKNKAINELTKGKSALGSTPVDKKGLHSDYQNYYATKPAAGKDGKVWLGSDQEKRVFDQAENYINKFDKIKNPTVADVDRLRRNINAIDAPTNEALAARSELYNITKRAADTATNGQYSQVLKPFEGVANSLDEFAKLNRGNPNASKQFTSLLRNMKTDYGSDTIKKVLGQDVYDMLLGKATAPWFSRRSGAVTTLTGLAGIPLGQWWVPAVAAAGSSPRIVSGANYMSGSIPAGTLEEVLRPLSKLW